MLRSDRCEDAALHEGQRLPKMEPKIAEAIGDVSTFPASYAQQRLWFLDQLEPATALYNVPAAFRLRGRLDVGALERSLNEIVQRHEALRTTFDSRDGEAFQVVHSRAVCWFLVIDLSQLPEELREKEALRRLGEESQRPFDLCAGPLLRSFLFRLTDEDHILLLALHHIICDGWSMKVIQREIGAVYAAYLAGANFTVGQTGPPVRRLRRLAAKLASRRHLGEANGLLADPARGCSQDDCLANGSAAPSISELSWGNFALHAVCRKAPGN